MKEGHYFVYIVASKSRVLYTGMTNDVERRVWEHKNDLIDGFSKQYRCIGLCTTNHSTM
jgi:putative endonuclease